jgi:hypothetical protein
MEHTAKGQSEMCDCSSPMDSAMWVDGLTLGGESRLVLLCSACDRIIG